MKFEWDEKKNLINLEKHKISFELISLVFDENLISKEDERHDYNETRHIGYGLIQGRCINVIFTKRGEKIRIISGRKANAKDTKKYNEAIRKLRQNE
jgi:uncharacterized DUF497 family protein